MLPSSLTLSMESTSYRNYHPRHRRLGDETNPFSSGGHDTNRQHKDSQTNPLVDFGVGSCETLSMFLEFFRSIGVQMEFTDISRWTMKVDARTYVSARRR